MKKLSTFAAAALLAVAAAAPGMAQDVTPDPFVSSQGSAALSPAMVAAGLAVGIIVIAVATSDSSSGTTTTGTGS